MIDYEKFYDWVLTQQPGLVEKWHNLAPKRISHDDPNHLVGRKLTRPSKEIKPDAVIPLGAEIKANAYTMVVTSCDRHDLLFTTLDSFYNVCDSKPAELIVVEDSAAPRPEWTHDAIWKQRGLVWLSNTRRIGQIASIDRAYQLVRTEYIFHCEDDWQFQQGDFVKKSLAILRDYPAIYQVSLRGDTGWHDLIDSKEYPFAIAKPYWRGSWGGFAFNPGMRRLADYRALGSYGMHVGYDKTGLKHEEALSKALLDQGRRIADLGRVIAVHTGDKVSRANDALSTLPSILIAVPACFKFEYGKWESEDSPRYDPVHPAYGKDIHISGNNPRISAVRETWFKDAEAFPNVTCLFFYGKPEGGYPRQPLPDEIFLDVPDDYEHLIQKTMAICRFARNSYDYLLKVDDDTATYIDRAVLECMLMHPFHYAGWTHSGLCTGGPGYWLSHVAMGMVADGANGQPAPNDWAEDMYVGRQVSGRPHGLGEAITLTSHRPGFSDHWFFPEGFDPERDLSQVTTFHACQPEVMRDWYRHERG